MHALLRVLATSRCCCGSHLSPHGTVAARLRGLGGHNARQRCRVTRVPGRGLIEGAWEEVAYADELAPNGKQNMAKN